MTPRRGFRFITLPHRPRHGYHTLPDGTLTPLHVILALIVAGNGTIYATTIYPFTLLKVETVKALR